MGNIEIVQPYVLELLYFGCRVGYKPCRNAVFLIFMLGSMTISLLKILGFANHKAE